ncbi:MULTISPECIES: 4-hydroxyphenylpyruvate dioxygenase [unclassified Moorena]|uniref:4-hydroxyphenylpyruvate dioxygenase n=1 Tax=unclassified Moorena TaxID=2683338 RepID=UPI0013C595DA|nr:MULTISPECIES: 4-hydroxyphenylpyruvate dioxygenase [unclassified Moorena]NEO20579.1 4-hydroxyphenylpyruvate dioxygenase [Moorena sp. SIO4A5]NEQ58551.1 4-hydroxyphenylpyruvate dioxygenase [Moorena sp. SIO4A1]
MKIDHVHFYVRDATVFSDWLVNILGFQRVASGSSHHTYTEVVKSGSITFVISSPLTSTSPIAEFLRLHPPGVADIAFLVEDLEAVIENAIAQGNQVVKLPQEQLQRQGRLKWSKIPSWGSLVHTLVERDGICEESFFPAQLNWITNTADGKVPSLSREANQVNNNPQTMFTTIDHVVLNVAAGELERAVNWYQHVLGFCPQQIFSIKTQQSGLYSQVMVDSTGEVQLPINEPTSANSQIQEFLDFNGGPGIQHIALRTSNIVEAIAQLRGRGLPFIEVPSSYYRELRQRPGGSNLPLPTAEWEEIATRQILVDWQQEFPQALLLQTFTQPIFGKPTFFFEIIERRFQAKGFGEGNFRALFEAIEREQNKRGALGTGELSR